MLRAVRRRDRAVAVVRAALGAALAGALLAGCGGAAVPADYDSTGLDELEVPTPTIDPRDFVDEVDNEWLPLEPGTTWRYERRDGARRTGTSTATVLRRPAEVAGVTATVVLRVDRDEAGAVEATARRSYAQDARGNVWLLAEQVDADGVDRSWEAGRDGARAGLAMAAEPRPGDGYVLGEAPGIVVGSERVVSVGEEQVRVPAGAWDDVVRVERDLGDGAVVDRYLARGVGLVAEDDDGGEATVLVALTAG